VCSRSMTSALRLAMALATTILIAGCTAHPPGEAAERQAALDAGQPFEKRADERDVPPLPDDPTPGDLVKHALLVNPELEQRYWEWRSTIEQIPRDGTQPTNLVLFAGIPITNGSTAFKRTTVTAANDPMADILWPDKLTTAARRALENAKAAGGRFEKARYELRAKVLNAYYEYALTATLIRLEQQNTQLLETMARTTEAHNRAGTAGQQDLLKARNEVDLSKNDLANMQAQLLGQRATLNALLNRRPAALLPLPTTLPSRRSLDYSDDQLLDLAAKQNPELTALAREIRGREEGFKLARLQYLPDFSLSAGTDLAGIAQNIMGMITVPVLRREAIDAAVRQAEANLRAVDAMRRRTGNDVLAQVVANLATLRDADRQLDLFERSILPRARGSVTLTRSAYESGRASLLDLLDAQRSLITIERLVVRLRITRESRLADVEAVTATTVNDAAK
jgi:outer membrane protein, heavy metal efflux system